MRRLITYGLGLAFVLSSPSAVRPQEKPAPAADAERAADVLRQARAALGGEAGFGAVKSLTATGKLRRVTPKLDQSGEFQIQISLPAMYRKVENLELIGDITATTETVLNGDNAWRDTKSNSAIARVVKASDAGTPQALASQLQDIRAEFSRFLLAWLLTAPSSFPAELRYGGEAEIEGEPADVVSLQGSAGEPLRLVIGRKTHRPLLLLYKTRLPVPGNSATAVSGKTPEEAERAVREAQKLRQSQPQQTQEAEVALYLSDYREVGGLLLPHRMTRVVDGKTSEEWEVKKFGVNAPVKEEDFRRK